MPARTPTPINAITSATATSRPKHNGGPRTVTAAHPGPPVPAPARQYRAHVTDAITDAMPRLARDLRSSFYEELDAPQRSALLSWLAFTGTFAAVRGITYSIRAGKGPFRNLSVGSEHLHH